MLDRKERLVMWKLLGGLFIVLIGLAAASAAVEEMEKTKELTDGSGGSLEKNLEEEVEAMEQELKQEVEAYVS